MDCKQLRNQRREKWNSAEEQAMKLISGSRTNLKHTISFLFLSDRLEDVFDSSPEIEGF